MNSRATVAGAHGNDYCERRKDGLLRYLHSLSVLTDCDHYVVTNEMPDWLRAECKAANVELAEREPKVSWHGGHAFELDVHRARLQFLEQRGQNYRTIIHTCARDIIFQRDLPEMDGLHLTAEGMTFAQSESWNAPEFRRFTAAIGDSADYDFEAMRVINGGQIIASPGALLDLCLQVFRYVDRGHRNYSDQPVVNWLVHNGAAQAIVAGTGKGFGCHHPNESDLCLTGEAVRLGVVKCRLEDCVYKFEDGRVPAIVHQYDRIKIKEAA